MSQAIKKDRRDNLFTPLPVYVNDRTITTVEDETVPLGFTAVVITPDADAWFANGTGVAAVPSAESSLGAGSWFQAKGVSRGFDVSPGQKISGVAVTGTVHVSYEYFG